MMGLAVVHLEKASRQAGIFAEHKEPGPFPSKQQGWSESVIRRLRKRTRRSQGFVGPVVKSLIRLGVISFCS